MRKILSILLILCVTVALPITVSADEYNNQYVVTASYLNVRQAPGTQYAIVGGLYRGTIIRGGDSVNGWTPINYNNTRCYVCSSYLARYSDDAYGGYKYTQSDLDLLARVVNAEAGSSWMTDEHQRAVASVVMNRVADSRFPNTIYGVVYQRGQYSCTCNGAINKTPTQKAYNNAKYVLDNGVTIPTNVVFQAQFRQGRGVWKYIQGHYFCY